MSRFRRLTRLQAAAPLSVADVILADSPVGFWRFSESPGSTIGAADSSGNGHDLFLGGSYQQGIPGKNSRTGLAVAFATTGFGGVTNDAAFRTLGDYTFEFWIRLSSALTSGQIIAVGGTGNAGETTPANYNWYHELEHVGGNTRFRCFHEQASAANTDVSVNVTYTATAWNHFAVTRDVAGNAYEVYLNGLSVGSVGYANDPTDGSTGLFELNRNPGNSNNSNRNTEWDEVAFFSSRLSAARIFEHYRAGRR